MSQWQCTEDETGTGTLSVQGDSGNPQESDWQIRVDSSDLKLHQERYEDGSWVDHGVSGSFETENIILENALARIRYRAPHGLHGEDHLHNLIKAAADSTGVLIGNVGGATTIVHGGELFSMTPSGSEENVSLQPLEDTTQPITDYTFTLKTQSDRDYINLSIYSETVCDHVRISFATASGALFAESCEAYAYNRGHATAQAMIIGENVFSTTESVPVRAEQIIQIRIQCSSACNIKGSVISSQFVPKLASDLYPLDDCSFIQHSTLLHTDLTGTATVAAGTPNVVGTGTLFQSELNVEDAIRIDTEIFTVQAIASDTALTLDSNHVAGATDTTFIYRDPDYLLNLLNGDGVSKMSLDRRGNLIVNGGARVNGLLDVHDGSRYRVRVTSSITTLTSGNGSFEVKASGSEAGFYNNLRYLRITGELLVFRDGGADRVKIDGTDTILKSPGSTCLLTLSNTGLVITGPTSLVGAAAVTGALSFSSITGDVHLGTASAKIYASDDLSYLELAVNGQLQFRYDGTARIFSNNVSTLLSSPDGDSSFYVDDSGVYLDSCGYEVLDADATHVKIWSPDNNSSLLINNTQVEISSKLEVTGEARVCAGSSNAHLHVAPYSAVYAGGSIVLEGSYNSVDADYSDWNLDNFWGYIRLYNGADYASYVRIMNGGSGNVTLQLDDDDSGICVGTVSAAKTPSAGIEIRSVTQALLLSRMTTTERNALTALDGMVLYNTTDGRMQFREGGVWVNLN